MFFFCMYLMRGACCAFRRMFGILVGMVWFGRRCMEYHPCAFAIFFSGTEGAEMHVYFGEMMGTEDFPATVCVLSETAFQAISLCVEDDSNSCAWDGPIGAYLANIGQTVGHRHWLVVRGRCLTNPGAPLKHCSSGGARFAE
jgi:hypothetical protein